MDFDSNFGNVNVFPICEHCPNNPLFNNAKKGKRFSYQQGEERREIKMFRVSNIGNGKELVCELRI